MLLVLSILGIVSNIRACSSPRIPDEVVLRRDWVNVWRKNVRILSSNGGRELYHLQKVCPARNDDLDWRDGAGHQMLRTDNRRGISRWPTTSAYGCHDRLLGVIDSRQGLFSGTAFVIWSNETNQRRAIGYVTGSGIWDRSCNVTLADGTPFATVASSAQTVGRTSWAVAFLRSDAAAAILDRRLVLALVAQHIMSTMHKQDGCTTSFYFWLPLSGFLLVAAGTVGGVFVCAGRGRGAAQWVSELCVMMGGCLFVPLACLVCPNETKRACDSCDHQLCELFWMCMCYPWVKLYAWLEEERYRSSARWRSRRAYTRESGLSHV